MVSKQSRRDTNNSGAISRRNALISLAAVILGFWFYDKKSKYDITNYKNINEINDLFENQNLVLQAQRALKKVVTQQINAEDSSNNQVGLAKLWIMSQFLGSGPGKISLKKAQELGFEGVIAKATREQADKQQSLLNTIRDSHSPTSFAMFEGLRKLMRKDGFPEDLKQLVNNLTSVDETGLFINTHPHIPVIPVTEYSNILAKSLKINIGNNYAKFIYSCLFMISTLETGNLCPNPNWCGYNGQNLSSWTTITWPSYKGHDDFGKYQFTKKTFSRISDIHQKRTGSSLDFRSSKDHLIAAAMLVEEKLFEHYNNNKISIDNTISTFNIDNTDHVDSFLDTLAKTWIALGKPAATSLRKYQDKTLKQRLILLLKAREIAKLQFELA